MAPIRIAFIGLSAGGGWAKTAHLPYLQQTTKYKIVGICNSSMESSKAAVTALNLPSSTKTYGSPDELAADSDSFDLAICAVRVDKHLGAIKSIAAKNKACYVEWPLGNGLAEAQELRAAMQRAGGARTVVGLQSRATPIVHRIKQLVGGGAVGRVLSSTVASAAGNLGPVDPAALAGIFNDARTGCNMLTIHCAHVLDYVLFALGQDLRTLHAVVRTQLPTPQARAPDGSVRGTTRDTPDQILVQGTLDGGAVLSVHQRGGAPFKGEPGLRWRIYGDRGEIEVTAAGTFLQIGYDDMTIKLHEYETDEVRTIEFAQDDLYADLPLPARNVGRLYDAFAEGDAEHYADWDQAVARHVLLEKITESSTKGIAVSL